MRRPLSAALFLWCASVASYAGAQWHGIASWYGKREAGHKTANGERFNPYAMTAANRFIVLGRCVRVTVDAPRKSVIVRVNDRGPYAGNRLIDLSEIAAERLGFKKQGLAAVTVELLSSCAVTVQNRPARGGTKSPRKDTQ